MNNLFSAVIGIYFGILLVKSEVASWFRIQRMFRFEEAHMFLIIGSAIVVGAISILLIKKLGLKTVDGQTIEPKGKKFQKGTIIGGLLFGMGWAITGACPGPIYAQIGSGEYLAGVTFAGVLLGAYAYAFLQPRLPH
jgi:uncharacterized membrane protein YedE/YeeE